MTEPMATPHQVSYIKLIASQQGYDQGKLQSLLGVKSYRELTSKQASELIYQIKHLGYEEALIK